MSYFRLMSEFNLAQGNSLTYAPQSEVRLIEWYLSNGAPGESVPTGVEFEYCGLLSEKAVFFIHGWPVLSKKVISVIDSYLPAFKIFSMQIKQEPWYLVRPSSCLDVWNEAASEYRTGPSGAPNRIIRLAIHPPSAEKQAFCLEGHRALNLLTVVSSSLVDVCKALELKGIEFQSVTTTE